MPELSSELQPLPQVLLQVPLRLREREGELSRARRWSAPVSYAACASCCTHLPWCFRPSRAPHLPAVHVARRPGQGRVEEGVPPFSVEPSPLCLNEDAHLPQPHLWSLPSSPPMGKKMPPTDSQVQRTHTGSAPSRTVWAQLGVTHEINKYLRRSSRVVRSSACLPLSSLLPGGPSGPSTAPKPASSQLASKAAALTNLQSRAQQAPGLPRASALKAFLDLAAACWLSCLPVAPLSHAPGTSPAEPTAVPESATLSPASPAWTVCSLYGD